MAVQTEGSYWQAAVGGLALLKVPRVRWVVSVTALEGAMAFGTLAFVPSQLVQHFGLSASLAGGLMALYGVGGLAYSQQARRWLGWFGERGLAQLGSLLVGAGLLMLAWTQLALLAALGGNCHSPIAALTELHGDQLLLHAALFSPDGAERVAASLHFPVGDPAGPAELARLLLDQASPNIRQHFEG